MSAIADIKERIDGTVTALQGRVEEVADLAALVGQDVLPQRSPWAWVIPLGFNAGEPARATGAHMQILDEAVGVVLYAEAAGDPKGKRAVVTIDALEAEILANVCGWLPDGAIDVVRAVRSRLVALHAGAVFHQIDLAIKTQLRIIP